MYDDLPTITPVETLRYLVGSSSKREGAPHRFSDEVASTLRSDMGDNLPAVATVEYIVRRPTPLECERLQGLPDDYTKSQ